MSQTAELPSLEELNTFVAPPVLVGQSVMFYPNAHQNSRTPSMGFVMWVNGRLCNIFEVTQTGGVLIRECVRHVSDPKLKLNEDQRENGAWDYTPFYKQETAIRDDIEDRLAALEQALIAPDTKSDRLVLLNKAKDFDIRGAQKMRSEDLRALIAQKVADKAAEKASEGKAE